MTNELKSHGINIEWNHFQAFIETLDLSDGMCGEHKIIKYHNTLSRGIGKLEAYSLIINIADHNTIGVKYKSITITQNIPVLYSSEQKCAKSGDRRYVLFGPREKECSNHYVERGLNQQEINVINSRLLSTKNNLSI